LAFEIRNATLEDAVLLATHRMKMWADIHPEQVPLEGAEKRARLWIERQLSDGRLVGFIAKARDGEVAGSGCIWVRDEQPRPSSTRQVVPYLMSMYTERGFRRKGVARAVVKEALRWCRENGYERVVLHASNEGRPLYESLGFEPTSEMRLKLEPEPNPGQSSRDSG
jgi:GNAT superfamily N-acetyltransferase